MADAARIVGGLALGVGAAAVFFVGLAATVRRLATARRPGAVAVASLLLRSVLLVALLLAAAALGTDALVAALVGLLAFRVAVLRRATRGGGSWT